MCPEYSCLLILFLTVYNTTIAPDYSFAKGIVFDILLKCKLMFTTITTNPAAITPHPHFYYYISA
jgi:hypothetical protein